MRDAAYSQIQFRLGEDVFVEDKSATRRFSRASLDLAEGPIIDYSASGIGE